jgi:type 1 glutamine amidotransferase
MTRTLLAVALAAAAALPLGSQGRARIPVMVLDGESGGPYHDWPRVTAVLKKVLDETGLFDTTVVTTPPATGDFSGFAPDFGRYQAVVMNYDAPDERWPAPLKASFEAYVRNGGGLVAVHATDNAFPGWQAFNDMMGVGGWRGRSEKSGPYWFYRDGKLTSEGGPGPAGTHGRRMPFQVVIREGGHPITKGLPRVWMHQGDELYARLRGPGRNMTVLATAFSDPQNAGSGRDEPVLMVLEHGKGRVFHTTFGHDVYALSSVDGIVTLQRGTEWAATGRVTQKIPATYPTADTVSYRADVAAMDPSYRNGLDSLTAPRR